jgi:hypothetical protein
MGLLQALTFTTPWALVALALLPVIWWLLRFTPPRPQTVRFPPLRLLLELINREEQPDRTPWWLMLLRLAIAAIVIIAVSHPYYAPGHVAALRGDPLLLIVDDSWAAAAGWDKRQAIVTEILDRARKADAVVTLATSVPDLRPSGLEAAGAESVAARAAVLRPKALDPDRPGLLARLEAAFKEASVLRVVWLTDGIDDGSAAAFALGLTKLAKGSATVEAIVPELSQLPLALAAPAIDGGRIKITALRAADGTPREARAVARSANGRTLGEINLNFAAAKAKAEGLLDLPVELRNEVQRIDIDSQRNAAASFLMDDRWRRKSVGLISGESLETAQPLLSPLYYVSRALEPYGELAGPSDAAALKQALDAGLSMLVLADIGVLPQETRTMVQDWVSRGGVLLRFAGPRLAGALTGAGDPLIPVTLREGGRSLGSALSWETPQALQDFPPKSPFAGLVPDATVRVTRQVLAEPDGDLPDKVWAVLADGTPLVTARREAKGLIVLVHVTANADWSNLPLTGLFVDMLRRVLDLAPAAGAGTAAATPQATTEAAFAPYRALSGNGDLIEPLPETKPIAAALIDKARALPQTPAGLYRRGPQERAINIVHAGDGLTPIAGLPSGVALRNLAPLPAQPLAPLAFMAAFLLFLLDCLAALMLGGGFSRLRTRGATAAILLVVFLPAARADAFEDFAMRSALGTHLAYVLSGDADIDGVSEAGLKGLGLILRDRTSIEPGDPIGVNIESDELVFFPLLYWPMRADAAVPSNAALAKMDAYMKNGGTIFFDLREDGAGGDVLNGGASAAAEALRRMLAKLDIPPIEPVPPEHVLSKSFYLLQSFPGRYDQGPLWVERADAEGAVTGNADGVSSIIIGSNDYAAAWAVDHSGEPLYAVIPGTDRQREMAFRSGINIVMYALTGNYKADQVHIPALLERLGQ